MPEYVFPHCARFENEIEKIKGINRLYAFPKIPRFENDSHIVILDSGAFGLSRDKRKMSFSYMKRLSQHYKDNARENTLCIAPDEFLNPINTMKNFRKWLSNGFYSKVTAVLQPETKGQINLDNLKYQAEYYRHYTDTICLSNTSMYAVDARYLRVEELFKYCKKELDYKWIHVLGAGFSLDDIQEWKKIEYFDSMDSIAYYTTQDKSAFGSLNPVENIKNIRCII